MTPWWGFRSLRDRLIPSVAVVSVTVLVTVAQFFLQVSIAQCEQRTVTYHPDKPTGLTAGSETLDAHPTGW